jgi:CheY-like chemotaxis protein
MPRDTILCVDDDASVLNSIQNVLQIAGYKTLGATSGEEALKLFGQNESGLMGILLDLKMGGLNGIEVMKEIRKTSAIPTFAVSAFLDPVTVGECEKAGFTGRIDKPFNGQYLLRVVREYEEYAKRN